MKQDTFDWIWNQLIVKHIDEIISRYKRGGSCVCDFRIKYDEESPYLRTKKDIQEQYELIRDNLKRMCYGRDDIQEHSLDQHKIAACFCKALVEMKVFKFNFDESTPDDMIFVNYYLAYHVSLEIISLYLEASYIKKRQENEEFLNTFNKMEELCVPESKHGEYNEVSVTTIALNDFYNNEFNLLSYAREMFWLEYYNRQIIENDVNPSIELFDVK